MKRTIDPDSAPDQYSLWQLMRDVAKFLKPYRGRFFVATVSRLVGDMANLYPAYALLYVVNFLSTYSAEQSLLPLVWIFILWIVSILCRSWGVFISKYLGFQVAEQVGIDAERTVFEHMLLLDMSWHEKENSGNKLKRISNGGSSYSKIIKIWLVNIIEIIVNFVGIIFIVWQFDILVSSIIILFLVTYSIISRIMIPPASRASYQVNIAEEAVQGFFFEAINNIRTVKVMSIAPSLKVLIAGNLKALFGKIKRRIFRFQIRNSVQQMWGSGFRLGGIGIIIAGIMTGKYELGFLVLFIGYFDRIWESVRELSDISQDIVIARQSIFRMHEILKEPVIIDNEEFKLPFPESWSRIQLDNVSFSYGDAEVLRNISFTIRRGEKIGIVGLSGAGKSTLFKLLLKEHESYTGEILIDDTPLRAISKQDYFKFMSVVFQDTEVFNFSLKDNITLVNTEQKDNRALFHRAMDVAHVTDFIPKLPSGVDTKIGEKGVKLSGGEKQRLGIARAIFKQPQILLLDEATSHLDLESEEKIRDSLHLFFEEVTAIVIAHRLTTIKEMDTIYVIENGEVIESGNFETLHNAHGRFYELWEKQKL